MTEHILRIRAFRHFYTTGGGYATDEAKDAMALLTDYDALAARLAALQSAAWDVCDVVQDALDDPEDADIKRIQAALDVMGELIPVHRPTDREDVAR